MYFFAAGAISAAVFGGLASAFVAESFASPNTSTFYDKRVFSPGAEYEEHNDLVVSVTSDGKFRCQRLRNGKRECIPIETHQIKKSIPHSTTDRIIPTPAPSAITYLFGDDIPVQDEEEEEESDFDLETEILKLALQREKLRHAKEVNAQLRILLDAMNEVELISTNEDAVEQPFGNELFADVVE